MSASLADSKESSTGASVVPAGGGDSKSLNELLEKMQKLVDENNELQSILNQISAKYISVQGDITKNTQQLAMYYMMKHKHESEALKKQLLDVSSELSKLKK
jgi:molecular chaperone GrpE (heat shock protein)